MSLARISAGERAALLGDAGSSAGVVGVLADDAAGCAGDAGEEAAGAADTAFVGAAFFASAPTVNVLAEPADLLRCTSAKVRWVRPLLL